LVFPVFENYRFPDLAHRGVNNIFSTFSMSPQTYRSGTSFAKKGKSRAVATHAQSHRSVTPVAKKCNRRAFARLACFEPRPHSQRTVQIGTPQTERAG
jgi:hypothetical protein